MRFALRVLVPLTLLAATAWADAPPDDAAPAPSKKADVGRKKKEAKPTEAAPIPAEAPGARTMERPAPMDAPAPAPAPASGESPKWTPLPKMPAAELPPGTYGVRVYELFQDGPRLVLEERTSRTFEPRNVRNLAKDATWPPDDQPPIEVFQERDHLAFFASYWREDGANEFGKLVARVIPDPSVTTAGYAGVRVRVEDRAPMEPEARSLASAPVADSPSYLVKLYEVFQRGPDLVLEERTTRAFGPSHLRNVARGALVPPEDHPGLAIWKSRDHMGFFGAAWRTDNKDEKKTWDVAITEVPGESEMGSVLVRAQVRDVARVRGPRPERRVRHPQHDQHQLETP